MSFLSNVASKATDGHTNGTTNDESHTDGAKRPVRIAGASGGFSDRQRAISSLAKLDVDVIVGDWLSERTMTLHGAQKVDNEKLRAEGKLLEEAVGLFDPTFIENLSPALPDIARKGIKVAVNAGACDTSRGLWTDATISGFPSPSLLLMGVAPSTKSLTLAARRVTLTASTRISWLIIF